MSNKLIDMIREMADVVIEIKEIPVKSKKVEKDCKKSQQKRDGMKKEVKEEQNDK